MKISEAKIVEVLKEAPAAGLTVSEVSILLGLGKNERRKVGDSLLELVRAGKAVRHGRRYGQASENEASDKVTGMIHVTPTGKGFVDRGEAYDDVRVAARDLGPAMDGDTVEVQTWEGRRRTEGVVMAVVSRGRARLVGNLVRAAGQLLLEPDDPRLPPRVEVIDAGPAKIGDAVLGDIVRYPEHPDDSLAVKISRVLGEPGILVTEVAKCVAGSGLDEQIPEEVARSCEDLPREVSDEEVARRMDLRHLHFVTIDPMSARDFDDAVAVEHLEEITRVWVAVADVSHYVLEDSPLDREARWRGCSLYLPDRAIHMLPESLSAGICSLVPRSDRLAMVVRLDISPQGQVVDEECAAAVIHSRGRLDYGGVASALQGDFRGLRASYAEHAEMLETLHRVTSALRQARLARGALDLDLPEAKVVLDEDDPSRVRDVVESRPDTPIKQAYGLIEELMVAANEAVGRTFQQANVATIWRIHPTPAPDLVEQLCVWLASYNIKADARKARTEKGMCKLLREVQTHRAARPLSYLVLRTLKQAVYSVTNAGHFGLASTSYLHFTSPIRRYPDLHVHRLLKDLLRKQGLPAGAKLDVRQTSHKQLTAMARETSAAERRAIEVEREVRKLYCASLMRDRIDDQGWAMVTGLTPRGMFVALDEPKVEGMVPTESLSRRVEMDPDRMRLLDDDNGRIFSLGDRVLVQVADVSVARRQVTLLPVEEEEWHQADPEVAYNSELYSPSGRRREEARRKRQQGGGDRRGDKGRRRAGGKGQPAGQGGRRSGGKGRKKKRSGRRR